MTPSEVPCLQNGLPARVRPNPSPPTQPGAIPMYGGVAGGSPTPITGRDHQFTPYADLHWFLMRVRYVSISIKMDVSFSSAQSRPDSDRIFEDSPLCLPCRDPISGMIFPCPYGGEATLVRQTLPFTLNAVFIPSGVAILDTDRQDGPSFFSSLPNEVMEPGYTVYTPKEGTKHGAGGILGIFDASYYKSEGYPWDPIPTDFTRWWLYRNSPVNPAWAMRTNNGSPVQLYNDRKYSDPYPYDYPKDSEYLPRGEAYIAVSMVKPILDNFESPLWPGKPTVGVPQKLYPERSEDLFKTSSFAKLCQPIPKQPGQDYQYYKENREQPIVQYFPYGAVDIYESKTIDKMGKTESFAEASYFVCFNTDVTTMNWEPQYNYLNALGTPLGCNDLQLIAGEIPTPKPSSIYPPGERGGYTEGPTVRGFISSYEPRFVQEHLMDFFKAYDYELLGGRFYYIRLNQHLPANWPITIKLYAYLFVEANPIGDSVVYANMLPEQGSCAYELKLQYVPQNSIRAPEVSVKVKYRSWNGAFNTDTGAWQL
jgi:hypothetical protein